MAPPSCWSMPSIGPAIARISSGSASPLAADTLAATGPTILAQVGRVPSTHSERLQARADVVAAGSVVVGSSHTSASLAASATPRRSASATLRSPSAATTWRAVSCAATGLTGPPSPEDSARPSYYNISPSSAGSQILDRSRRADLRRRPCRLSRRHREVESRTETRSPKLLTRQCGDGDAPDEDPATPPSVPLGVPVGAAGRTGRPPGTTGDRVPPRKRPQPRRFAPRRSRGSRSSPSPVPTRPHAEASLVAGLYAAQGVGKVLALDAAPAAPQAAAPAPAAAADVTWRTVDITDPALASILDGVDVVVHRVVLEGDPGAAAQLAAETVLTSAAAAGVPRAIIITSASVYGAQADNAVPLDEAAPLRAEANGSDPAGCSRWRRLSRAAEQRTRAWRSPCCGRRRWWIRRAEPGQSALRGTPVARGPRVESSMAVPARGRPGLGSGARRLGPGHG